MRPLDMLKSPIFWLLYVMFVLVAGSGLMATAQIAPIALDFKLADQRSNYSLCDCNDAQ